jgi:hypothetical protein
MEVRRVTGEEVLRVMNVNGPDLVYPSYGKRVAEDVFEGGRLLRVVFVDTPVAGTDARIVSAIDLAEGHR